MLALVLAAVASFGFPASGAPTRVVGAPGVTKDEIVLGVTIPLSGNAAAFSANMGPVSQALTAEFNAQGGVAKHTIVARVYDDGSGDPSVTAASYEKVADEAFLNVTADGTIAAPLVARRQVPTIYAFGTQDAAVSSRYAFPVFTDNAYQAGKLLPEYLLENIEAKNKKIAVIYETGTFLGESKTAFIKAAKQKDLNVVINQRVDPAQSSCTQEVANVMAKKPDIVFADVQLGGLCMFREAQRLGWKPTWVATAATWQYNFLIAPFPGYFEATTTFAVVPPLTDSKCGQEFQALMQKYFPDNRSIQTDEIAYSQYVVFRRTLLLLDKAGPKNLTRNKFVNFLETVRNFDDGCSQPVSYRPGKRRGGTSVMLITVKDNQWVTADPKWRTSF